MNRANYLRNWRAAYPHKVQEYNRRQRAKRPPLTEEERATYNAYQRAYRQLLRQRQQVAKGGAR